MTVKPLHDRVLIKVNEEMTKTASGIIIPDSSKDKPSEGEVIAVGSGYRLVDGSVKPLDVKAGDKVLFDKWGGAEVKVDGNEYLMMKEEKIEMRKKKRDNMVFGKRKFLGSNNTSLEIPIGSNNHNMNNLEANIEIVQEITKLKEDIAINLYFFQYS